MDYPKRKKLMCWIFLGQSVLRFSRKLTFSVHTGQKTRMTYSLFWYKWPYKWFKLTIKRKKIVSKAIRPSPNTTLSNFRKYKRNIETTHADTNFRLNSFCREKNIKLLSNHNIKAEHLGIKKLDLKRKVNSLFAKNLANFVEANREFRG